MTRIAIGIDIGGSSVKLGAVDERGSVLVRKRVPITQEIAFQDFVSTIAAAVEDLKPQLPAFSAIGIGVPGTPDPVTGMLLGRCPAIPSLVEASLLGPFSQRFGVPAIVRNDAICATYGEMRHGAGRGLNRFVLFTLGTGIGGSVVIDRKVIDGPNGLPPQLGCMSMDPARTDIADPVPGMLENLASARALVNRYRQLQPHNPAANAEIVVDRARSGEAMALQAVDEVTRWLAQAIGIMSNMLNLEAAIIGGGLSAAGSFLTDRIARHVRDFVLLKPGRPPAIVTAEHGNNAGLIGAGTLALDAVPVAA
ncbi:sugar kinase [Labrys miyagiensis]|uniref:Sugar kinase n=1 Tax=Labrys miyagiensis TaxID=346912 RepID=A0ABQ6CXX3_9HYPH|nr:ROK family protein [Labrys miyagiensis]GLS23076.1 sugar kinase [Labrys miyagiensis]